MRTTHSEDQRYQDGLHLQLTDERLNNRRDQEDHSQHHADIGGEFRCLRMGSPMKSGGRPGRLAL